MDDQPAASNGTPDRIPFADGPTDTIPIDWAEDILRGLYADHRPVFGALMLKRLGVSKLPRKQANA